ncbi:unnamed protein product [Laminaria digitata]
MSDSSKNEGEGNRTADRKYREDARKFAKSGKVENAAEKAREAIDGDEREELKKAEEKGKDRAKS